MQLEFDILHTYISRRILDNLEKGYMAMSFIGPVLNFLLICPRLYFNCISFNFAPRKSYFNLNFGSGINLLLSISPRFNFN